MKNLVLVCLGFLLSSSAFARVGVQYECSEYQKKKQYRSTLFLSYPGHVSESGDIAEGKDYEFDATLYYATNDEPLLTTTLVVRRTDVMLNFRSKKYSKTKIDGIVFLDEADDAWMTLNGDSYKFKCVQKRFVSTQR